MIDTVQAKQFLIQETWILAWSASVQRADLYLPNASSQQRAAFRRTGLIWLKNLVGRYAQPIDESIHRRHLLECTTALTALAAPGTLRSGYRLGIAQKAVNLALKYHWCLGLIPEPPHCPIDRIVLNQTHLAGRLNWTELVDITDYDRAIDACRVRARASKQSLAQWELGIYARRSGGIPDEST